MVDLIPCRVTQNPEKPSGCKFRKTLAFQREFQREILHRQKSPNQVHADEIRAIAFWAIIFSDLILSYVMG
ncbi:hypothetical protein DAMNIGENAA_31930 [Desulforhabdus amnigena]|uniref:Uncharacterized protein n=1 Tax=Desulforhabdus amnigena TaxID=40218 RepID=A0A9W6LA39_9BACT|nr:hypothetical protein DAMNIGENAA_31930 [Desulforhabdus amnigena]